MRTISKTELQTWRRCQREHFYAYEMRVRPIEKAEALRVGSLWDAALETWWQTVDLSKCLVVIADRASDPFEAAKLSALISGYHARWIDEPYDVLGTQVSFYSPLPFEGFRFGGKFDAVVRHQQTNIVSLVESKSSNEDIEPGGWYWKRLALDIQVSHYLDGAKRAGYDAVDIIYDVAKKPALKPLKKVAVIKMTKGTAKEPSRPCAGQRLEDETPKEYGERCLEAIQESPETYFQRANIVRLREEATDASSDLLTTVDQIVRTKGRRPRNPDACFRYGSACPYYGVCTRAVDINNTNLFRKENAHL